MAIRVHNASGDTVTVLLGGREEIIPDDGRASFDTLGRGVHTLHVHRTRIPLEGAEREETDGDRRQPFGGEEKSLHTQLDYTAQVEVNSVKATLTVKNAVRSDERLGADVIFSSYEVQPTGARLSDEKRFFANAYVHKQFKSRHLKNIFLPAGLGGAVIFLLGIAALVMHLSGNTVNLGGTEFTLPWSLGLSAAGAAILAYTAACLCHVFGLIKKYKAP